VQINEFREATFCHEVCSRAAHGGHPSPTYICSPCSLPQQPKSQPIGHPATRKDVPAKGSLQTSFPPALRRPVLSTLPATAHQQHPVTRTPRNFSSAALGHLHPMSQWAPSTSTETPQYRNKVNAAPCHTSCLLPLRYMLCITPVVHRPWPVLHTCSLAGRLWGSITTPTSPFYHWFPIYHPLCWRQTPLSLLLWAEGAGEQHGFPGACLALCTQHMVPAITLGASRWAPKAILIQGGIKPRLSMPVAQLHTRVPKVRVATGLKPWEQ